MGICYRGEYRFRQTNMKHREPYWESRVWCNGIPRAVVDAAGRENGEDIVHLIPYGEGCSEIDTVLQTGDFLAYVQKPMDIPGSTPVDQLPDNVVKEILKGRATHAELGYLSSEGNAKQVSLWACDKPVCPEDRPFHQHTDGDVISIYRVSLRGYGVDSLREQLLKEEIKRWKEIVRPVSFPYHTMDIDLVDFATIDELKKIAQKLVNRSPQDQTPAFPFELNCVQWSTLVFSLAICFPLSKKVLAESGLKDGYDANWADRLGYAEDGLVGLNELPIPFYTAQEIVENICDLYFPSGKELFAAIIKGRLVEQCLSLKGIPDGLRIMPNAFVIENRLRGLGVPRKTKSEFEYIGTAVPEWELIKEVSHA